MTRSRNCQCEGVDCSPNETVALRAKVNNLAWVCRLVDGNPQLPSNVNHTGERNHHGRSPRPSVVLQKLSKSDLPSDIANTMALLEQAMQEATTEQIADGLTVLHGLFGSRGEPEVVATTGVEIIKAEDASTIALYSALLRMVRPARKERAHELDDGNDRRSESSYPLSLRLSPSFRISRGLPRENQSRS